MKTTKFIYALALTAVLGMTSCGSDFLNTPTDSRVELNDPEKLRMLLVSSYPSSNYAWPCEIMTDNIEDNNAPDAEGQRYNLSPYNRGDEEMFRWQVCVSSTSADSPSQIWESHYGAIAGANAVLEVLDKWETQGIKPDATTKAIRGEALLIRSYCHFMLAQVFCMPYGSDTYNESQLGIPYIKRPETTVKPMYERGTLKETYDNIRKDLLEGLPLISDNLYEIPKYHFNKAAANAFAARFYLFTREYDKCLEHCDAALGGEGVDPSPYMSDLYAHLGDMFYIYDFGKYQQGANRQRNLLLIATYSQMWRHYIGGLRFACTRDALLSTIHGSGPTWGNFKYEIRGGKTKVSFVMHPSFMGSCGANAKSEYGYYFAGNVSEQFEYTDKLAGIGYTHVTRSEFTGEEVILTRAEAKLFLGDIQGAVDDLSVWEKARRNCPAAVGREDDFTDLTIESIKRFYITKPPKYGIVKDIHIDEVCPSDWSIGSEEEIGVLQCIQHFRRLEMLHTGMRWFDIKRLGLEFDRKIGKEEVDHLSVMDPRKAMQIPPEIQAAGMQANKRPDVEDTRVTSSSEYVAVYD